VKTTAACAKTRLEGYRTIWQQKPVLRVIYQDYYRRIMEACRPGLVLEIGGGSGNLKAFAPRVISTDILSAPWLDAVADAQALPFGDGTFDGIVMVDVLHHLEVPRRFLKEAQRVLRPGGRLVLVEPAITPLSWIVYRFFHHEPVTLDQDPLAETMPDPNRDPYDSNSALPTLLFCRARERLARECPGLVVRQVRLFSLVAYPLSGGFRSWSLLPSALVAPALRLEKALEHVLGRLMAFRLLAVVERI
jgi:SAM-dependent methyltransferase